MSEVGSLIIKLQAETAQFREDMGRVKSDLNDLKGGAQEAGEGMDASFTEARGGMMLTEELVGFRLPRHLNSLIAQIPGVGTAFAAILPIVGAVFIVDKIVKYIEKVKEAQEALTAGFSKSLESTATHSNELSVSIEKSKMLIDKLNGKYNNGAALALAEARVEADKLSSSLVKDLDELIKLMSASAHGSVMTALLGTSGSGQAEDVAKGLRDAIAKIPHDSNFSANMQKALVEAHQRAQSEIDKNNQQRERNFAKAQAATGTAKKEDFAGQFQEANVALQEFQEKLSASYNELDLVRKDDSFKKEAKDIELAQSQIINLIGRTDKFSQARKAAAKEDERIAEEQMHALESVDRMMAESYQRQSEQNVKVAQSYDAITLAKTKAEADGAKSKVTTQASLGLITKQQEAAQLLAIGQKEAADFKKTEDAKLQALKDFASQSAAIAEQSKGTNQEDASRNTAAQAQIAYNNALKESITQTQSLNDKVNQQQTAVQKLQFSWAQIIGEMRNQMPTAAQQMQSSMTKALNCVSQGIAKSIVEGKSLGQEMRQVVQQMAEQWIEYTIKKMLMDRLVTSAHITGNAQQTASDKTAGGISQLAAAKAGAAKAYQAMAGIPIIGPELGALAAAAAFATMMAFEQGGKIPGAGAVPIIGHGGETVVTKALTDRVESAERGGNTSHNNTQVHATFAPTIHAINADGVEGMLKKHHSIFQREFRSAVRKMNK